MAPERNSRDIVLPGHRQCPICMSFIDRDHDEATAEEQCRVAMEVIEWETTHAPCIDPDMTLPLEWTDPERIKDAATTAMDGNRRFLM